MKVVLMIPEKNGGYIVMEINNINNEKLDVINILVERCNAIIKS